MPHRSTKSTIVLIVFLCIFVAFTPTAPAQPKRIVIAASTLLDGKGQVIKNTRIVIEANAWSTLIGGFTTVQSVGNLADIPLRDAINKGELPGPRILTSAEVLMGQGEKTGSPDEIRAFIRKQKEAGADVIKIFAAGSVRRPDMLLSQEQLNAACDEAKKLGLRTLVHAYKDAVRAASLAGCTQVEHGTLATDEDHQRDHSAVSRLFEACGESSGAEDRVWVRRTGRLSWTQR